MNAQKKSRKKFYTVEEANAALPLLRSILRDVTELAQELRERHDRLARIPVAAGSGKNPYSEEMDEIQADLERGQEKMHEYEEELKNLHVELKDYYTGLVDFPCWMEDRAVYLCWRLGEPEVAHWHELDAGFAGRQKLADNPTVR
jgi:hypothetical protein